MVLYVGIVWDCSVVDVIGSVVPCGVKVGILECFLGLQGCGQFVRCVVVGGVDGGGTTFVWVNHCVGGGWLGYCVYEVGGGVVGGVNWR